MGSSTAGGSTEAMMASSRSPPAAPVEMPRKEVTSEAAVRPRKTCGETSGIPRKSIPPSPAWRSTILMLRAGSFSFPWPPSCAMADVVNDHLVLSNLIYDQIVANWQSPEARFAGCLAQVGRLGNSRCRLFDPCGKARCCLPAVGGDVGKDFVEIGERAAFKAKFHTLR